MFRKKTKLDPDEFELYNLTKDPLEEKNLADPMYATEETILVQKRLTTILEEQSLQKRLTPTSGQKSSMPSPCVNREE
jgi:hypothetical protein